MFEVSQGQEKKEARFFDMAVNVHSSKFKKALKFLYDHNYTFSENESKVQGAKAVALRKREAKCDRKIAESIEKMSRCHYQMEFFDSMQHDVRKHIQNKIIEQNSYLRMLQQEPQSSKYGTGAYRTKPGLAKLDPTKDSILMPSGDSEMQKPKFYEDNRYWIIDEVDKYQAKN